MATGAPWLRLPARAWAGYWRALPWRRRVVLVGFVVLVGWVGLAALNQALWSYRYWRADPWSESSPVQWTLPAGHVARLDGLASRIRSHLPADASLAVSPDPALAEQGFYFYLWLAYVLPEHDVRRVHSVEDGLAADYWVVFGQEAPPTRGLEVVAKTANAMLYRTARPAVERPQSPSPPAVPSSEPSTVPGSG